MECIGAGELIAGLWRSSHTPHIDDNDDDRDYKRDEWFSVRRGSISLSAVFWVKATAVLNAAADQPRESGMTPGETSYGGPPTGTTLHIKRPRERRTALSNHCHRRRRRRHSFRFNFFPLAPYSSLFFFLNARDLGIRPSAFLPLSICDPPIFLPR